MKFDIWLLNHDLLTMADVTQRIEALGFDGMWTSEAAHNAFFPLVLATEHSKRITMGTNIAVAFPRNPTILAHIGWDLARYSNGRFIHVQNQAILINNQYPFIDATCHMILKLYFQLSL